jgi:hypothetical protein
MLFDVRDDKIKIIQTLNYAPVFPAFNERRKIIKFVIGLIFNRQEPGVGKQLEQNRMYSNMN